MEDDCRKIQDDEKLVIQSIYEKEARFEVNAWKIWKPLSVALTLTPIDSASRNETTKVSVELRVLCSANYPQIPPNVSLSNPKGISKELVQVLQENLKEKCKSLIGSAMILELCSEVQNFLYENTSTKQVAGSFHDNMVKNLEEKQHEKQRQRLNSEIREVEQVEKIVKERELIHLEAGKQEEEKPKPFLEDAPIRVIAGKTIAVKSSNFSKRQKPSSFCTEWIGVYQNEEILVSEWLFKYSLGRQIKKNELNFSDFLRKLDEIESNIKDLSSLTGLDQTVVPYLFCTVERRSILSSNINIVITIGQRIKESEQSLPSIINSIKHEPNICRRLAGHAVCALRWMHEMQLVHGAVTSNSFWVSDNSFRVSDAGTLGSLLLLTDAFQKCINGGVVTPTGEEKFTRKKDLFALGTMIDSIRHDQASSDSMVAKDTDLTAFIKTCQSAKSVEELLNMPYLKVDLDAGGSGNSRFGTWHIDENSRLMNDFIVMKKLGSGGFGDVLLARNKVDDGNYAIKRIPLYAKSEKLNRRITREAKLFSKLNHPNVVRYYSAWTENAEKKESDAVKRKESSPRTKEKSMGLTEDSLLPTRLRNLENGNNLQPRGDTTEWSSSYLENGNSLPSSDDEDLKKVETIFDRGDTDDDDFICFEGSAQGFSQEADESEDVASSPKLGGLKSGTSQETPLTVTTNEMSPTRLLYIQMEFCGRGTLRSLIDAKGLVGKAKNVWRMFRQILAGLSYIHKQNMIHRDIKPMNILIDEEDRIKIGDFGLATRDFFRKMDSTSAPLEVNSKVSGQTKDIGTELYMAPELFDTNDPAPYSSKIDVYSTGVVLFEMFYRPLPHGMERFSTLKGLKKNIAFPPDFGQEYPQNQQSLAKKFVTMMLQEKAENRPTVDQLLEDERIDVDGDDKAIQGLLQKALKSGSQVHRNLLEKLFQRDIPGNLNYCFDNSSCQEKKDSNRHLHLEEIKERTREILTHHCYQPMHTHQLLASTSVQAIVDSRQKPVFLLDSQGFPVALPLDLRQNFVRYCCRNNINRKKRYCIDRVYRSSDGIGFEHPTERWEASIDAIGPLATAVTMTAEMMATAAEIVSHALPNTNLIFKIGHFGLVIAACRHFTLTDDQTNLILQKLHEISTSNKILTQSEKIEALSTIIGSKTTSHSLLSFFPLENSFASFRESFKALIKSRDEEIRNSAIKALGEIQKVTEILEVLEVSSKQVQLKYDASLVYRPATFHDGLLFMIAIETTTKSGGPSRAIVLGGGRYDSSLVRERHPKDSQPKVPLCLIGCSIALDVLASLRKFYKEKCSPPCSLVVCSLSDEFTTEKFMLARRLWNRDLPCDIMHEPVSQLTDFLDRCNSNGVSHVLVVFEKDKALVYTDGQADPCGKKTFDSAISQCLQSEEADTLETSTFSNPNSNLSKSQSSSQVATHAAASVSNCNIKFAMSELGNFAVKKRLTNAVMNALPSIVSLLSSKNRIEVVVTELSTELVKIVSGAISRQTSVDELAGIIHSLSHQYGKSKEDLELLFTILKQLLSPKTETTPIIIIYRNQDGFYKVIM